MICWPSDRLFSPHFRRWPLPSPASAPLLTHASQLIMRSPSSSRAPHWHLTRHAPVLDQPDITTACCLAAESLAKLAQPAPRSTSVPDTPIDASGAVSTAPTRTPLSGAPGGSAKWRGSVYSSP